MRSCFAVTCSFFFPSFKKHVKPAWQLGGGAETRGEFISFLSYFVTPSARKKFRVLQVKPVGLILPGLQSCREIWTEVITQRLRQINQTDLVCTTPLPKADWPKFLQSLVNLEFGRSWKEAASLYRF